MAQYNWVERMIMIVILLLLFVGGLHSCNALNLASPVGSMERKLERFVPAEGFELVERVRNRPFFCGWECPPWEAANVYRAPPEWSREQVCEAAHDRFSQWIQGEIHEISECFWSASDPFGKPWRVYVSGPDTSEDFNELGWQVQLGLYKHR